MINNATIQKSIVAKLKSVSAVTDLLYSVDEVREDNWQGREFNYANVRVAIEPQTPIGDAGCNASEVLFTVLCFSEDASSKEADDIAWQVNDALHDTRFTDSDIRFIMIKSRGLIPAERRDMRTWVAEARFRAIVQIVD